MRKAEGSKNQRSEVSISQRSDVRGQNTAYRIMKKKAEGLRQRKKTKIITKAPQLNTLRCHFVDSTGLAKGRKHEKEEEDFTTRSRTR
jgi:hypothetical protein